MQAMRLVILRGGIRPSDLKRAKISDAVFSQKLNIGLRMSWSGFMNIRNAVE
jgi:hypothetical protein